MRSLLSTMLVLSWLTVGQCAEPIKVLFLGDQGHHRPSVMFRQLEPVLKERGIALTYTEDMADLNAKKLGEFEALAIYANIEKIEPAQEKALLDFVASGKGLVPIHCASYCFLNSQAYIDLVGGQFQKHGFTRFRTRIVKPNHPIMQGFDGFESEDETYVHTKHNAKDREVLEVRADDQGFEPWTWTRTHGKGRVFYTAWGHDERTWSEYGFPILIERGIRWATGGDPSKSTKLEDPQAFHIPEMTKPRTDVKPFEYIDVGAKIPHYTKGAQWGKQAEPDSKMQKPLMPEESLKHIVTPVGFEVKLFMSEQDFKDGGKPIAMTWDERGRLWICETVDYPNELGQGRDRIRICEDTNNDGRADKFTIFAEKLSIPSSIAFSRGGAIVQNGTETIYLKDTNGDDVADERKTLITGWGLGDTHGGVSNFQYGLDNWIWGMQGYNDSRPTPVSRDAQAERGPAQSFRQGFFRFKSDGSEIEFIRSTNNNTWGLGISEEGLIFGSTANHCPSVFMPIPNRYYEQVKGWSPEVLGPISDTYLFQPVTENVRQVDQFGGYTAGCGHAIYTARNYPQEYWNRVAFVCEPTGHLVGAFPLRREGADFKSQNTFNLVASDDEWFSPIMAEVGPDGNVWVLDWYNYIIQHNPTPIGFQNGKGNAYESDLRDKKHGRIYRVVYTGGSGQLSEVSGQKGEEKKVSADAPAEESYTLKDATPEKLVATLKHPNMFWRKHAQRLLVERGKTDNTVQLLALIQDRNIDEIGQDPGAVHALWTIAGLKDELKKVDGKGWGGSSIASATKHPSPAVQRNAFAVLAELDRVASVYPAPTFARDFFGRDPQVVIASLLALADSKSAACDVQVAALLRDSDLNSIRLDRMTRDALTAAAVKYPLTALVAVANLEKPLKPELSSMISQVAQHYAREGSASLHELLAELRESDVANASVIVKSIAENWPKDRPLKFGAKDESVIVELFKQHPNLRGPLSNLAAKLGSKALDKFTGEIAESYLVEVRDTKLESPKRIDAAKQLVSFRKSDAGVVDKLLGELGAKTPPELAAGIIEAIGQSEAETAGAAMVKSIGAFTPATRTSAIRLLISREAWTPALLTALDDGTLQLVDLTLDQKQALANHPQKKLAEQAKKLLARGGGLPNADRQKVLEELLPLAEKTGDAKLGAVVFEKQCAKCHMHSGKGNKIGPDLTGMSVHPKKELLVHIIDPSRSVEGNYRVYTVAMEDGRIMTGLLAGESKTAIEIIDAEAKRHTIVRDEIEDLVASRKSLMPEGFEKQVTPDDITNLLEFLTQRGKYTPLSLAKVATVISTRGMFFGPEGDVERMVFPDWSPKTFHGVPFALVDPQGDRVANAILLHGPEGKVPPTMPKQVTLPCNQSAKAIHLLSGVSGWGFPIGAKGSVSMIVRLKYEDGSTEDHELKNGVHFADYIRRVDVPESEFAFALRGQQLRYLSIQPKKQSKINEIELIKGKDATAPIVMAVTVEGIENK